MILLLQLVDFVLYWWSMHKMIFFPLTGRIIETYLFKHCCWMRRFFFLPTDLHRCLDTVCSSWAFQNSNCQSADHFKGSWSWAPRGGSLGVRRCFVCSEESRGGRLFPVLALRTQSHDASWNVSSQFYQTTFAHKVFDGVFWGPVSEQYWFIFLSSCFPSSFFASHLETKSEKVTL